MHPIFIYIFSINLITFLAFAVDKWKAKHKKWRIRESLLLGLSAFGGVIGGLISMYTFRHKTQTPIFKFGMPIILILQIAVIIYLYKIEIIG